MFPGLQMKNHTGVLVREAWPWSSLQKYPPISAQSCLGRGGKGPQLCPQAVVLSSWRTKPQRGQGHFSGFMDLFAGNTADTLPQSP